MSKKTCPVCNSKVRDLKKMSRDNDLLNLLSCPNCGHLSQDLNDYVDIYSDGSFTEVARSNQALPTDQKIKDLDKRALNRVKYYAEYLSDFDDVLEIGSSIGSFVHVLRLMGKKADGLEPDKNYAHYANEQYGFDQFDGMLEDFDSDKKFNAVCSFHVLEHVEDPHIFIKKAWDLLNTKGKILFELPSLELHSYGSMKTTIWKPHIHYYSSASLYTLFSQYFNVLKIGYYGSAVFIYAEKNNKPTFSNSRFKFLKLKSSVNKWICKLFPALPIKLGAGVSIKQFILQSLVFQHNKVALFKKAIKFGLFAISNKLYLKSERGGSGTKGTHISYYSGWENAGDTVLSKCVRDVANKLEKYSWTLQKVTDPVVDKSVGEINQSEFLIVGGGGVLLPDSNPNTISGWQWAITKQQLEEITVPLIIFAIGYNFFPGQKPSDLFVENLNVLIKRADFFSLRNRGSIEAVNQLTEGKYKEKIIWQPCPTTIIRKLYSKLPAKVKSKNIAVNVAYDRYKNRFGKNIYHILDDIALSLKEIENQGYKIYNVCHLENDAKFELTLNKHNVNFETVNLQYELPWATYLFYNKMELVMGMRGHAQMIPFGMNCKIISLGSHNKLKWFLEDINALEWYVDLHEQNVKDRLLYAFESIMSDNHIEKRLISKQDELYAITEQNLKEIESLIH